jgi:outer membrane protein TolC
MPYGNHEEIAQSIRTDVEKAAAAARCSAELLRAYAEDALPQAERNHATARRVYEAGEDSILVLLQAQKTLIEVRDGYNQALGDYALALVELERAVGGRLAPQGEQAKDIR